MSMLAMSSLPSKGVRPSEWRGVRRLLAFKKLVAAVWVKTLAGDNIEMKDVRVAYILCLCTLIHNICINILYFIRLIARFWKISLLYSKIILYLATIN